MVTIKPNGNSNEDDQLQTFGRLEDFGQLGAAQEHYNSYAGWERNIENASLLNMETPTSFVDAAILTSEMMQLMEILARQGRLALDAFANNRLAYVASLNDERRVLLAALESHSVPELEIAEDAESRYLLAVLPPGGLTEVMEEWAHHRVEALDERLRIVRAGIIRDREEGHFRDYGYLKSLYHQKDPERQLNGLKYALSPYPLKEAMDLCAVTMQNTKRGHIQALMARLMEDIKGGKDYENQRKHQTFGRRGKGRSSVKDDEE